MIVKLKRKPQFISGTSGRDDMSLGSRTIAAIRKLLSTHGRATTKTLLLEAGFPHNIVLPIDIGIPMGQRGYISQSTLINNGFDKYLLAVDSEELDGLLREIIRVYFKQASPNLEDPSQQVQDLIIALEAANVSLSEILDLGPSDFVENLKDTLDSDPDFGRAYDLLVKSVNRLSSDPDGAVTAAVSGMESIIKTLRAKIGLDPMDTAQLPNLLRELRRETNLESLLEERVIAPLSTLTENLYRSAHVSGDRHGSRDYLTLPPYKAILFVDVCGTLGRFLLQAYKTSDLAIREVSE